jgi:methylmalonyl-CoA mutase, C-terminal domain
MDRKIRVLLAKPGLDGHDRGVKVIASALRDSGMEVIYTGLRQTPSMIVEAAVQEDVDCVGISILSGAHMTLFPAIKKKLEEKGASDIILFGGGIIPDDDIKTLEDQGIDRLFGPGTPTEEIIEFVKKAVAEKDEKEEIL